MISSYTEKFKLTWSNFIRLDTSGIVEVETGFPPVSSSWTSSFRLSFLRASWMRFRSVFVSCSIQFEIVGIGDYNELDWRTVRCVESTVDSHHLHDNFQVFLHTILHRSYHSLDTWVLPRWVLVVSDDFGFESGFVSARHRVELLLVFQNYESRQWGGLEQHRFLLFGRRGWIFIRH